MRPTKWPRETISADPENARQFAGVSVRPGNLKAIGTMLVGVGFFSILDAGLKHLAAHYPAPEVMYLRAAASLPFLVLSIACTGSWASLRVHRPTLYLVRALLGLLQLGTFIYAVSVLSLSYTYAIYMSAPLMVAALARPMLAEHVPARRWAAIVFGLFGVVLALMPTGTFVALGGIAAAISASCYAFNIMAVRLIGRTDTNYAVVFWHLLIVASVAGLLAIPTWQTIAMHDWPWIAVCGLTGALGQYLFTAAFRMAPASTIAPFEYTAIVWGISLDWLVFGTLPYARVIIGGAIVIVGGLYVLWDERRAAYARVTSPP